jgi:hypothetical protein
LKLRDYIHIKKKQKCGSFYPKIEDKLPKDLFLKCIALLLSILKKLLILNNVLIAKDVIPVSRANRPG